MALDSFLVDDNFSCLEALRFSSNSKEELTIILESSSNTYELCLYLNKLITIYRPFNIILLLSSFNVDTGYLTRTYQALTCLSFLQKKSTAEKLFLCQRFIRTNYFLFLKDNFELLRLDFTKIKKIFNSYKNPIVISPIFLQERNFIYPSIRVPKLENNMLSFDILTPMFLLQETFYPLSFIGIYSVKLVEKLGFFDLGLKDDYYQLLDFSLRSFSSGFSILSFNDFALSANTGDSLIQRVKLNSYADIFNFRSRFIYKKRRKRVNYKSFSFLFRKMLLKKETLSNFYQEDLKNIIHRWKIENVEEVL